MAETLDNKGDNAHRRADADDQLGRELYFRYAIDPGVARSTSGFAQSESISRFADGPFSLMSEIQQRWGMAVSSRPQWPQLHRVWSTSRPIPGLIGADAVIEAHSPFPLSRQQPQVPIFPAPALEKAETAINLRSHSPRNQQQTLVPVSAGPDVIGAEAAINTQPESPHSQQQLQIPDLRFPDLPVPALTETDAVIQARSHPPHHQQQPLNTVSTALGSIDADAATDARSHSPHGRQQPQVPDLQAPDLPVPVLQLPVLRVPAVNRADAAFEAQPHSPDGQQQPHGSVAAAVPPASTEPKRANREPLTPSASSPISRQQHSQTAAPEAHAISEPSAEKTRPQAARSVTAKSAASDNASPAEQRLASISNPSGTPLTQRAQSALQRPIVSRAARSSSPTHLQRVAAPDRSTHPQAKALSGNPDQNTAPHAQEKSVPTSSGASAGTRDRADIVPVSASPSNLEKGREAGVAGQLRSADLPYPLLTGERSGTRASEQTLIESSPVKEPAQSHPVQVKESPIAPTVFPDQVAAIPLIQRILQPADKPPAWTLNDPSPLAQTHSLNVSTPLPPAGATYARMLPPANVEAPRHSPDLSTPHQSPASVLPRGKSDAASAVPARFVDLEHTTHMQAGSVTSLQNVHLERIGGDVSTPRGITSTPPAFVHSAPPKIQRQETSPNTAAFTHDITAHVHEAPASARAATTQSLVPSNGNPSNDSLAIDVDRQPTIRTAIEEPPTANLPEARSNMIVGPLSPSATLGGSGASSFPPTHRASTTGERVPAPNNPSRGVIHRSAPIAAAASGANAQTMASQGRSAIPPVVHPSSSGGMQAAAVIHRIPGTADNDSTLASRFSNFAHTLGPEGEYRDLMPSSAAFPISRSNSLQATYPAGVPRIQRSAASPASTSGAPPSVAAAGPSPVATPTGGPQKQQAPDITQLANRVYDLLVRRLSSERQRRGA
jgi:hypothetical protein